GPLPAVPPARSPLLARPGCPPDVLAAPPPPAPPPRIDADAAREQGVARRWIGIRPRRPLRDAPAGGHVEVAGDALPLAERLVGCRNQAGAATSGRRGGRRRQGNRVQHAHTGPPAPA